MKYRVTQPFIAFGIQADVGEVVDLTESQAAALREAATIAPYEIKVMPPPENKAKTTKKKPSRSAPAGPASKKKTAKKSKKTVKK